METIKLKILDEVGHTLMTCDADTAVSLVYTNCYKPGDRVALEIDHPGQYCVIQFEDTMPEALVYVVKREINFHIPFGEQAITYSPKSFVGSRHVIRARLALPEEIAARRNLAFNCYDEHGDTGFYPHASANVETRGEAVFAARNAIDGIFENSAHGEYPYQSWGINRDPNAALTLDFGREVLLDELRITERADFPHDNYWVKATVEFSDGSKLDIPLVKSAKPQSVTFEPKRVRSLVLKDLIQAEGTSPFPALTQIEAFGTAVKYDEHVRCLLRAGGARRRPQRTGKERGCTVLPDGGPRPRPAAGHQSDSLCTLPAGGVGRFAGCDLAQPAPDHGAGSHCWSAGGPRHAAARGLHPAQFAE